MKLHKIDHVGVIVNDLSAAKAFFLDFGLEVAGEWESEGTWMGEIAGLNDGKTACVGMRTPGGETWIELIQFLSPTDEKGMQQPFANSHGNRQHIAFAVEDIEAIVAKLKEKGKGVFSEIRQYEDQYKLCFCRGPEGIILELAEQIK
ncbi:VOC family protein [Aureibacillus halotolerans]|uniref:Catechol 2,3-dioxygenase-like lactoylglutathione lyase family enzyme n=1 Tax=Aureibacillus halotolerans TaxID=1508390 RepID=A0A4R6U4P8_9BACI|nr:VOC family protein [Aureibacillus halotolerans]TDQ41450.1 catechol 2,3-dioxygenase-like lactoylglutathione lyase family enzyme [Aureibacillus halotolerans]